MDLNIRILHHKDFLQTTSDGEINLETSKQMLLKLASVNEPPNKYDILIDVRDVKVDRTTVSSITQLIEFMIDHRASFRTKLAILTQSGPRLEMAKFMEVYAQNRGFQVAAFDDFEKAVLWLATITNLAS